jgi:UDP-N-acetylglucosamine 4,6-dehydratase/5-epimerase
MQGKTILVTGGTGSFGHRFTETALSLDIKKLIIFSRDELKQSEMAQEFKDPRLRFFLGDVRDRDRLYRVMGGVDYVVHAAAQKQIPAAERNPFECVKTNVFGAQNVIETAVDRGVEKVVALSTDKAAQSLNLYGATKATAERLFVAGNHHSTKTRFACVRYGNVINSRGSVIPLFMKQRETGVITVTDYRMTRFWITLDAGVELVLRAFAQMHGGETFVPKIPSMRITDLARAIAPDCEIQTIGIRPGEKLHEVMVTEDEARRTVDKGEYFIIQPDVPEDARMDWGVKVEPSNLPEGFTYSSDNNDVWLTEEELKCLL